MNASAGTEEAKVEQQHLQRLVGKAIWLTRKGDTLPKDASERSEIWQNDKAEMIAEARKLLRVFEQSGLTVVGPANT